MDKWTGGQKWIDKFSQLISLYRIPKCLPKWYRSATTVIMFSSCSGSSFEELSMGYWYCQRHEWECPCIYTGNCKTLKEVPREKGINVSTYLREFYHSYYSASYMTLVVISEGKRDYLSIHSFIYSSFSRYPRHFRTMGKRFILLSPYKVSKITFDLWPYPFFYSGKPHPSIKDHQVCCHGNCLVFIYYIACLWWCCVSSYL